MDRCTKEWADGSGRAKDVGPGCWCHNAHNLIKRLTDSACGKAITRIKPSRHFIALTKEYELLAMAFLYTQTIQMCLVSTNDCDRLPARNLVACINFNL